VLSDASWSPDGTQFVALGCEGCSGSAKWDDTPDLVWDLWVIAADGSGATKITHTPGEREAGPQWVGNGPDGGEITYWIACGATSPACPDGPNDTWLLGTRGGGPRRILSNVQYAVLFPDGSRRLLFTRVVPEGG